MEMDGLGGTWCKPAGGVAAVGVTPIDNIIDVCFSPNGQECISIELCDPALMVRLPLCEEGSSYDQILSSMEGIVSVTHTLTAVMPTHNAEEVFDAKFKMWAANGVVAIITARSGECLLAGWSDKFGAEQPLKLIEMKIRSGVEASDEPITEALFRSEDTSLAAKIPHRDNSSGLLSARIDV